MKLWYDLSDIERNITLMKAFFVFFRKICVIAVLLLSWRLLSPKPVNAETCSNFQINGKSTNVFISETSYPDLNIQFNISGQLPNDKFIVCTDTCGGFGTKDFILRNITLNDGVISFTISGFLTANSYGPHRLHVRNQTREPSVDVCEFQYEIKQTAPGTDCEISVDSETVDNKKFTPNTVITVEGKLHKKTCGAYNCSPFGYPLVISGQTNSIKVTYTVYPFKSGQFSFSQITRRFPAGLYFVELQFGSTCNYAFKIEEDGSGGPQPSISPAPRVTIDPTCETVRGSGKKDGIKTALGCIPASDLNDFVGWLLRNVIFVASGIAFLLMAFGALQIITSAGSPDKMKAGSELITSALSGLLLIILSLFLLKLIGVDILQLPGFGK